MRVSRQLSATWLPVVDSGRLVGAAFQRDVAAILEGLTLNQACVALNGPVSTVLRPAPVTIRPEQDLEEVWKACCAAPEALGGLAPVADDAGYQLGVVDPWTLMQARHARVQPARIGGMATPFGVYLTDGTLQAGASNLSLFVGGAATGILLLAAVAISQVLFQVLARYSPAPYSAAFSLEGGAAHGGLLVAALAALLKSSVVVPFFLLLRCTPIAGYHAAEHQTVHAVEREEPLVEEVVARMPRAHPRCGTNLVAGLLVFTAVNDLVSVIPGAGDLALVISAVVTLLTWRQVGTFLQVRFTTRKASSKQLSSGMRAGEELLRLYSTSPPRRANLLRRIWCMGILQSLAGMLLAIGAGVLLPWSAVSHYLGAGW